MGVRRLSVFLGAAVVAWAGVFTWVAGGRPSADAEVQALRATAPQRDAETFERLCASCHGLAEMRKAATGAARGSARRAELERFLARHGRGTPDENTQVLDFLVAPQPDDGRR